MWLQRKTTSQLSICGREAHSQLKLIEFHMIDVIKCNYFRNLHFRNFVCVSVGIAGFVWPHIISNRDHYWFFSRRSLSLCVCVFLNYWSPLTQQQQKLSKYILIYVRSSFSFSFHIFYHINIFLSSPSVSLLLLFEFRQFFRSLDQVSILVTVFFFLFKTATFCVH